MPELSLKAIVFVCSLKPSPQPSSSDLMAHQVLEELAYHGVQGEIIRAVDYNIMPGVKIKMGEDDDWPALRKKMMAADIMLMATPTWLGSMSSVAQRVLERLDAELSQTDNEGRLKTYGKVAGAIIVGNEDGAHKITADLYQALGDVGFTIPANGVTYWNGEAMHKTDYKDLDDTPDVVKTTNRTLAANAAHLARLLKQHQYPIM